MKKFKTTRITLRASNRSLYLLRYLAGKAIMRQRSRRRKEIESEREVIEVK
jgi:hypothetical protein